ncbi:MAG: hypothetical protein QM808_13900 [Steroidobacteraceae bacterium]
MKQIISGRSEAHRSTLRTTGWCACAVTLGLATFAQAQVERPATNAVPANTPNAMGAANAAGGAGMGGGRNQQVALPDAALAADPVNFSGIWKVDNTLTAAANAAAGGMAAAAPVAAGMNAGATPNGMAAATGMSAGVASGMAAGGGGQINANGKSSGLLCIPDKNIFGGGDGGLEVIQTANQITLVAEENHRIRRIYLNAEHPKTVKPSYMGHSVGHWEGDTLVVDTIGLRSSSTGTIDRIRKINNGTALEVATVNKGDSGNGKLTILGWNGKQIAEWICEDYTDEFFAEDYK